MAVIGGGNSGIKAGIDLAGIVEHVTVLEFDSVLRVDEVLQRKAWAMGNIDIISETQTTKVVGDRRKLTGLHYTDRTSGERHSLELAGIFVQVGLTPNAELLKETVELRARGKIMVGIQGRPLSPVLLRWVV